MSRLAKTVVTEREEFVRALFRENVALTGAEVQTKLKEKFGKMMRPNRIYQLKAEVAVATLATATESTTGVVTPVVQDEATGAPVVASETVTSTVDSAPSAS